MNLTYRLLILSVSSLWFSGCASTSPDSKAVSPPREKVYMEMQDPNKPVTREQFLRAFGE